MKTKSIILMLLLMLSVVLTACNSGPGKYDDFAACLFEKEATMYGTDWCGHCQDQKKDFGKSFKYVDFVNCDEDKDTCAKESIKSYPTWIINGEKYLGRQDMNKLATLSGCELTSE